MREKNQKKILEFFKLFSLSSSLRSNVKRVLSLKNQYLCPNSKVVKTTTTQIKGRYRAARAAKNIKIQQVYDIFCMCMKCFDEYLFWPKYCDMTTATWPRLFFPGFHFLEICLVYIIITQLVFFLVSTEHAVSDARIYSF